jgi:uncharacterized protein (TIGR04255 family)
MSLTFQNAPLIELIAEVRWNPAAMQTALFPGAQAIPGMMGQPQVLIMNNVNVENFLQTLGGELYQRSYRRTERIVPYGFTPPPFQQICRYRSDTDGKASTLYQAGFGIFSAHALPPYKSWQDFAPVVSDGIDAVLVARDTKEKDAPFTSVSLKYIDAFKEPLTDGNDVAGFLSDVLGFKLSIPDVLQRKIAPNGREKPSVILAVPLANGMRMDLSIGEGAFNGEQAVLMEATVTSDASTPSNRDAVMAAFEQAHEVIHDVFVNITQPIHHLMQPQENAS